MDEIVESLCAGVCAEQWNIGFAAGCAFTFAAIVAITLAKRLIEWYWEAGDD